MNKHQEELEYIFCSLREESTMELHEAMEVFKEKLDNIFWEANQKAVKVLNSAQGETK